MKDLATYIEEQKYLETANRLLMTDHEIMRSFLVDLKHPEGYGHAVSEEVRKLAARILNGLNTTCNGFCGEYECKENLDNCKRTKK